MASIDAMPGKRTGKRTCILQPWLLIAVKSCLMKASKWREADKETIDLVKSWLKEEESMTDVVKLAATLGCSTGRIYRMFHYTSTPLSLAEFTRVCELFGKNPNEEFSRILQNEEFSRRVKLSSLTIEQEAPKDLLIHRIEEALNDYHQSNKPKPKPTTPSRQRSS